jgi:hypothetical protein
MWMTLWYLELCSAVAEGDIGCVFEVIKARFNMFRFFYCIDLDAVPAILFLGCWFHQLQERAPLTCMQLPL